MYLPYVVTDIHSPGENVKLTHRRYGRTYHFHTREDAAELEKKFEHDGVHFECQHDAADFQPFKVIKRSA